MATVELSGINKFYGAMQALFNVSLTVPDGEFVVFVGPSGCGKSTLLRTIAGLESVDGGTIRIGEKDVTQLEPVDRDVSMVFQSYALYPHMTVRANMEFGMKVGGVGAQERHTRVEEAAKILQLSELLERKPGQLSGGQRQRVAIGRSIVKKPKVFLFDEPLSNLDAKLRVQMRVELEALHDQLNATMIYVTHDQVEAMTMADQIVVLNAGRIEQVGSPMDLYHRPSSEFVAGFIGSPAMNIFDAGSAFGAALSRLDGARRLGIRPEHIALGAPGAGDLDLKVSVKEQLGGESYLYLQGGDGERLVVKTDGEDVTKAGQTVSVNFPPHRIHQFDGSGRTLSNQPAEARL
ncbi:sn-glycerol-3-phosphate ABC transporter ATP-binding protein UgpC [Roseobacter sp. YSTF-M11]|uniref:Sn-glycerol-3-phosphate ABC transporter ATP-binding protein UgpC n=1 Tax=Roseobacter insulae TaxID=2859783 RepID=A0A9X1FW23_9RHOB|nr:sn-glycerol-3-phosphate ABC transporter ATP-binding protein UgpC [Roseobacter insulae]MBW4709130.1 sn-glycerol-3-phosphate ABC transporter ATP-binding protein UgpC [Roseobacter insulae]